MSKNEHITEIAKELKNRLPLVITKEQLMNCYIHDINPKGIIAENLTVVNLITAAHIAGKHIKGKSKLEINVTPREQIQYIKNSTANLNQEGLKERIYKNKDKITALYLSGMSLNKLSKIFGCCQMTMSSYLKKFEVTVRPKGWQW